MPKNFFIYLYYYFFCDGNFSAKFIFHLPNNKPIEPGKLAIRTKQNINENWKKAARSKKKDDNTIYLVDYIMKLNRMWTKKKTEKDFFCLVLFLVRDIMTHFGIFSFINCNNQHFMISVNWIFFFISIDIV